MSLLDRLRGQPDWQHEDPQVRASAVDSLENDAQDVFAAIASEDADAGVRLAAVGRLSDPETIGRIARTDTDGQVRDEAASMLREIAVEATEPDVGEAALAGLSEPRDLGEVARTARLEAVGRSALGRLEAQKAIGAVARRSTHRDVRAAALDRLDDRGELVAVAVKTDHREIALAAFERLAPLDPADRDMLRTIAVRARTKPVSRRAKTALAELDARPVPLTADERRRRREALCERVEALVGVDRWDEVTAALDRAERDWRELEGEGGAGPGRRPDPRHRSPLGSTPPVKRTPPARSRPPRSMRRPLAMRRSPMRPSSGMPRSLMRRRPSMLWLPVRRPPMPRRSPMRRLPSMRGSSMRRPQRLRRPSMRRPMRMPRWRSAGGRRWRRGSTTWRGSTPRGAPRTANVRCAARPSRCAPRCATG